LFYQWLYLVDVGPRLHTMWLPKHLQKVLEIYIAIQFANMEIPLLCLMIVQMRVLVLSEQLGEIAIAKNQNMFQVSPII